MSGDRATVSGAQPRLILASASPRRLDLLRQIGIEPALVDPVDIDETPQRDELPRAHALRLARAKAEASARRHPDAVVLGADTVVACGRRILPKAETAAQARHCLGLLSGRRHRVLGGICVIAPGGAPTVRLVVTVVEFARLERRAIEDYLATSDWQGKAGGYAIQGRAAGLVSFIAGSYSNVVGLSLHETAKLLRAAGIAS